MTHQNPAPQSTGSDANLPTLYRETTSEGGVIRLSKWPEGYVLWFHGAIVWRSWAGSPQTSALDESEPGEHQEVLDAIEARNTGECE